MSSDLANVVVRLKRTPILISFETLITAIVFSPPMQEPHPRVILKTLDGLSVNAIRSDG
ncbi:hypothetical protein BDW75DRAFT_226469 [Aspergillus navahoensis]